MKKNCIPQVWSLTANVFCRERQTFRLQCSDVTVLPDVNNSSESMLFSLMETITKTMKIIILKSKQICIFLSVNWVKVSSLKATSVCADVHVRPRKTLQGAIFTGLTTGLQIVQQVSVPTFHMVPVVLCWSVSCLHWTQLVTAVSKQGKTDGGI